MLATIAMAFCLVPLLGLLMIPLAIVAILVGFAAIIIAVTRSNAGLITSCVGSIMGLMAVTVAIGSTGGLFLWIRSLFG